MTSVPVIALIVIAAVQAPGSAPARAGPSGTAPATVIIGGVPETAVATQSFEKLFTGSEEDIRKAQAQLRVEMAAQQPTIRVPSRIVCGMLVIQVDPAIDPKMIHRPRMVHSPDEPPATFHIRRIPPTTCAE
jgi:hypothetical protein